MIPTFIEVCSGCGGLSSGFIEAGFKPILLNEIEKTFCKSLSVNHPGVKVIHMDMKILSLKEYRDKVDVLMGGVPCQSYSIAGKRLGTEDPRGQLIIEFNRLVLECNPKVLLIENVKGLINHNKGETLKMILDLFNNDGKYKIYYKLLNAKDYEVPQKRERVFIIGVRNDIDKEFNFPEKSEKVVLLKDVLTNVPISIGATYPDSKKKVMELVPEGGCWVDLPEGIREQYAGKGEGGRRGINE